MNGNKGDNEIATYCVSYSANPGGNAYGIPEFILAWDTDLKISQKFVFSEHFDRILTIFSEILVGIPRGILGKFIELISGAKITLRISNRTPTVFFLFWKC